MWKIWLFWSWQCHPAKEFTPQGTACYLFRMAVKKVVGWERNGEKCSAGRIHSYLWARKRSCKSSNLNKISHLTCISTSCLILAFLCSLTHNSSCCPLILLQLPITPTHTPLCQLVSRLPHSVTCPFPLNVPQWLWLGSLPVLLFPLWHMPCSSPVAQSLYQTTSAVCHLGPFSLDPASPPMSFAHFMFGLPSSGSAVLLSHLIFSFIGLYCSQVVSPFLLPPPAWMPAEGAVCTVPRVLLLSAWHLLLQVHRCTAPSAEMAEHSYPVTRYLALNSANVLVLAKQRITKNAISWRFVYQLCFSFAFSFYPRSLFFLGERDKI